MMKKINIVQLTTDSKIGGTEKMLIEFAKRYDRKKYNITFITLIGNGRLISVLRKLDCKVYTLNINNKFEFYKIYKLFFLLKKIKPDILHTYLFHSDIFGRIIGKLLGIKIIISGQRSPDLWKKNIHKFLHKITSKTCDLLVANSEMVKNHLVKTENIKSDKIKIVNNGIQLTQKLTEKQIIELKQKNNIPLNKKIIGIVANLTVVKNYDLFIDICCELNKKYNNLFFVSIGEDRVGLLKKYEDRLEKEKITNLLFLGYKENITEIINVFDIFLLTSLWESSPRSILEAMSIGIPAVAPDVGGISELIINNITGFLYSKNNKTEAVEKLEILLNDKKKYEKMQLESIKVVNEKFTFDSFLKKTYEIYDDLYFKKNKIKIVEIIARLNVGGPAINVIYLTSLLPKKYFDVILITGIEEDYEGNMNYLAEEYNVKPIVVKEMRRPINFIKDIIALFKIIYWFIKLKPDIVHSHTAKAGTLGRIAAFLTFRKIKIHTFHGHIFSGYFGSLSSKIFLIIEKLLAKVTTQIITVSNYQKKEFIDLGIGDNKKIINFPLGLELKYFLELDKYKENIRNEYNIPKTKKIIINIARLVPIKNQELLVETAKILKNKISDFVIFIVGDGDDKEKISKLIEENNLEDNFILTGFRKDLHNFYAAADISVLCSKNEGLPTVIIESHFSKKPVVATEVGGIPDLIEHKKTGLLSKLGDAEHLSENIFELLENKKLYDEIVNNAYNIAIKKYTLDIMIKNYSGFYSSFFDK